MTNIESILERLSSATLGSAQEEFTQEDLLKFAKFYEDKWDENTGEDVIAESFVDYWWDTNNDCRRCSVCGRIMRKGYCVDMGEAYYCSDYCLHTEFSDEAWEIECDENDQSYYTEWS